MKTLKNVHFCKTGSNESFDPAKHDRTNRSTLHLHSRTFRSIMFLQGRTFRSILFCRSERFVSFHLKVKHTETFTGGNLIVRSTFHLYEVSMPAYALIWVHGGGGWGVGGKCHHNHCHYLLKQALWTTSLCSTSMARLFPTHCHG